MKSADRRALVRTLSDDEYHDVMAMCSMLPHVDIKTETQGQSGHNVIERQKITNNDYLIKSYCGWCLLVA